MTRLLFLTACLSTVTTVKAVNAENLIAKGDAEDARFQPDAALPFYLAAEFQRSDDASLLVKIARQHVYRMADLSSTSEKLAAGKTALDYAERAVKADPRSCEAHLSLAISLGKISQYQGSREKISASKRIREASERAVALDPDNDYAWHLLGRWHQAVAGMSPVVMGFARMIYGKIPDASNEQAVRCFRQAISLKPDRLIHHVELGRTYAQMGRAEEARAALEKGLSMPDREKDDPETKERGRATLKTLE